MKKFYSFMLMVAAMLVSANVWATDVADFAGLKTALDQGGEIVLTADINVGSEQLNLTKAGTVIEGNGFAVKGSAQYVLQIKANAEINNLVIYAAKSKAGRGILIDDDTNNVNVTLNNVTINATERGMDVWFSDNVTLTVNDSEINLVPNGGTVADENTGMPSNYDVYDIKTTSVNDSYSRGVNIGQLTNSTITINNTTIQGFFYNINNIAGTMEVVLLLLPIAPSKVVPLSTYGDMVLNTLSMMLAYLV
jgi:hypothetical protein